ncbi:MAG: hypothetical protein J6W84_06120 [Bacteroidales bacterium]|nr:hypothetical protein [Bacteroidales bacterium]
MMNFELADLIKIAEHISQKFGIAWLMSNGEEIKVAYTESERDFEKRHGFWVAVIFENGHPVEA